MDNVDGPKKFPSDIGNIARGKSQIPVSFTSEPNWVHFLETIYVA